jgi:isopenicillin N synthase-like dioxygenase
MKRQIMHLVGTAWWQMLFVSSLAYLIKKLYSQQNILQENNFKQTKKQKQTRMIIIKHFLPLAALFSIVDGSEYVHQSISSCSSQQAVPVPESTVSNATMISEPHKYFPTQIRRIVDAADAISPDAIDLPDKHSYPVIDISPWLNPSTSSVDEEDRQHVVNKVLKEAKTSGSFNIIGHGIEDTLFDRLYSSAESFFLMSLEQKMQYSSGNNLAGYVPYRNESVASINKLGSSKEQTDLRETFSMSYPPNVDGNVRGPQDFHDAMAEYIEQLQSVQVALKQIFTAALSSAKGIDLPITYLNDVEEGATGLLRAARYPSTPGFEDATKLLPHSDFGTITIIASSEEGLEEIREGRWYKVPMGKGELHVNVGQIYSMWSNGLFQHSIHRVSKEAKEDRISFPYFTSQGKRSSVNDIDVGVSPVCSDDEVIKFPRVSTLGHFRKYIGAFTGGKDDLWDEP